MNSLPLRKSGLFMIAHEQFINDQICDGMFFDASVSAYLKKR